MKIENENRARISLLLDVRGLGAGLAVADDEQQAAFLTEFCAELRKACSTHYDAEFQLASVVRKLSADDRELLAMLGPNDA